MHMHAQMYVSNAELQSVVVNLSTTFCLTLLLLGVFCLPFVFHRVCEIVLICYFFCVDTFFFIPVMVTYKIIIPVMVT